MKAFLMFKDRDFDLKRPLPPNAPALVQDLELETLFGAMAGGDKFIHEVARLALLTPADSLADIEYRQRVMVDCLRNPAVVRNIYELAGEAIEREKKAYFGIFRDSPDVVLTRSIEVLSMFVEVLRKLRQVGESSAHGFRSDGFLTLFEMLQRELSDDYFETVSRHLQRLKFPEGVLVSARLGAGNKGTGYTLREAPEDRRMWPLRLLPQRLEGYTLHVHPRDEAGGRALSDLRNRGLSLAARALGQSVDHILSFFHMLRAEVAFYIGGVTLHERLSALGHTTVIPRATALSDPRFDCQGLFDVCLAVSMNKAIVGNDVEANEKNLVIVTGANQGGKSTFLRSVGLAQLMMQSGLFVGADDFEANIVHGVFTHYRREEDNSMTSGKFDEELSRMSALADMLRPNAMVLFNESFASTNEREGSEVARQIVSALLDSQMKVVFVTHLYQFAHAFEELQMKSALFLRAERKSDGARTFKLVEGQPLDTSFGEDLYAKIFVDEAVRPRPHPKLRVVA
ncbi:MAG: DNA mismatch repair protein MutS [Cyanobacteria bacterium]|nr:DNA mismatch repair protein MutS [Cyanobacteriota bacterium]